MLKEILEKLGFISQAAKKAWMFPHDVKSCGGVGGNDSSHLSRALVVAAAKLVTELLGTAN